MNSTGAAAGFFQGQVDEVRIWNVARSAGEIARQPVRRDHQRHRPDRPLRPERGLGHDRRHLRRLASTARRSAARPGSPASRAPDLSPPAAPSGVTATAGQPAGGPRAGRPTASPTSPATASTARRRRPVPTTGTPLSGATPAHGAELHRHERGQRHDLPLRRGRGRRLGQRLAARRTTRRRRRPLAAGSALQLDGTNDYVTFGQASALGVTTFTLETWFRRTGAGVGVTTGNGGIAERDPADHEGRRRERDAGQRQHELLPRDRRVDRRAGRRLRGARRPEPSGRAARRR